MGNIKQELSEKNEEDAFKKKLEEAIKQYEREKESETEKARKNIISAKDNYAWINDDDYMVSEEEFIS